MVALLGKDQEDDSTQKAYCEDEFEKAGDEKTATTDKQSQLAAAISEATDAVASLTDDLATLAQDVKDLDKAVAQATEQRKEEHATFLETTQLSESAIQLVGKAKNRLNKFYNPTLYKAAPKTENTMEEKIIEAGTFVQVRSHDEDESGVAPPPPPETFGAYEKKGEKSAGVIGLMDMMVKELESDMKDGEYEEKTSQTDYAKLMEESQASRTQASKSIVDKTVTKADMEGKLDAAKTTKTQSDEELALVQKMIGDLHVSCDFLLQNYDLRAEARTNEIESLKTAKAILSGANFGF